VLAELAVEVQEIVVAYLLLELQILEAEAEHQVKLEQLEQQVVQVLLFYAG
jgi:hypothetical protein